MIYFAPMANLYQIDRDRNRPGHYLLQIIIIFLLVITKVQNYYPPWIVVSRSSHSRPWFSDYFCKDNENLALTFELSNHIVYNVWVKNTLDAGTELTVKFDSQTTVYIIYFEKYNYVTKYLPKAPDKFCGRRKVNKESIPLIVSGSTTKAGHWPWHAAINKLTRGFLNYICGGTLISKYVSEVIVHDEYTKNFLNNDIALLKLSTEVTFNNFVQPACIWFDRIYDNLPSFEITGTNNDYNGKTNLKYTREPDHINNVYYIEVINKTEELHPLFEVQGEKQPHHPPYITSFKINGSEKCRQPDLELFGHSKYTSITSKYFGEAPDKQCGRRKLITDLVQKPLIVSGSATDPGWWPWHAAIYKIQRNVLTYICGGTLISKLFVLTAGHCVTIKDASVNPEVLRVVLGKYSLFESDVTAQSMEVNKVIVHHEFQHKSLNNDIALLKLNTEAYYDNYVQPACLWFDGIYDQIGTFAITGTVIGWGFDESDTLSKTLHTSTMPQVSDVTCIMFEPIFYYRVLNGKKFCAGNKNGTAPCNGDSGGGFLVFVSDEKKGFESNFYFPTKTNPGAWYVKGIVSSTLSRSDVAVCQPNGYTVFTDVAQYRDWILSYL